MEIYDNILPLIDLYDVFFVDVYGVLFDGLHVYNEAVFALEYLKKSGKTVIILSNTTELAENAQIGYSRRGLICEKHYDRFVTSGEFLNNALRKNPNMLSEQAGHPVSTVNCLFLGNGEVFQNTSIQRADDIDAADIMYVGLPRSPHGVIRADNVLDEFGKHVDIKNILNIDWSTAQCTDGYCGLRELAHVIDVCLKKNKTLLVANPDIFAHSSAGDQRCLVMTQGSVGYYYEIKGGKTIFCGKPYANIFEFAKTFVPADSRIAMVGDTPWTDIAGANNCGIDSVLVSQTGVTAEFIENRPLEKGLDYLLNTVAPVINHSPMKNVVPMHIIKRFRV